MCVLALEMARTGLFGNGWDLFRAEQTTWRGACTYNSGSEIEGLGFEGLHHCRLVGFSALLLNGAIGLAALFQLLTTFQIL
jgi:hypothetical protein